VTTQLVPLNPPAVNEGMFCTCPKKMNKKSPKKSFSTLFSLQL
jgi:hypothetical protein